MKIVIHIERLVLEGIPIAPGDRETLRNAVAVGLSRLLAGGLNPELMSGGAYAAMRGPRFELHRGTSAAQLGGQIASAAHCSLGAQGQRTGSIG